MDSPVRDDRHPSGSSYISPIYLVSHSRSSDINHIETSNNRINHPMKSKDYRWPSSLYQNHRSRSRDVRSELSKHDRNRTMYGRRPLSPPPEEMWIIHH